VNFCFREGWRPRDAATVSGLTAKGGYPETMPDGDAERRNEIFARARVRAAALRLIPSKIDSWKLKCIARVSARWRQFYKSETNSNFLARVAPGLDRHRIQFRGGERKERKRKKARQQ